ncbi:hypothetical protein ACPPVT_13070 [Angustibacter sp. McL0619]|uniref:hypothetical protein n=1 Tax=Angustibacter sp. McL0619 TaxID=3415676 RepID=UPI003CFAB89C
MSEESLEHELDRLRSRQSDLLTRAQLRGAGVTRAQLRWRLSRSWHLVLPEVVNIGRAELTASRQLVAALLEAGDESVLTGHRACIWHGLRSARGNRPVTVLVPRRQASRSTGFLEVMATARPVPAPMVRGILRLAPPARAVVDAARSATSADEATSLVIEAVQRRLVTLEELDHEVEAGARRGSQAVRSAVRLARAGAWSAPEAGLLTLCSTSPVLSRAWPNPSLEVAGRFLISPDVWFDDVGLALMVHSRAYHQRDADWEGTVERDGELAEHGVVVLGFTPSSIGRRPAEVLQRIERVYTSLVASNRVRPGVRMSPRGFGLPA